MNLSNDTVIHHKKNNIEYLQFRRLLEYEDLIHCFTLKPLDFGSNKTYENQKEKIKNNYKKMCETIGIDECNIVRPYQTHTTNIEYIDFQKGIYPDSLQEVDGLITNKQDKILSLSYADCTPLYFFEPKQRIIANIHSGWKGTLNRIGEKAVEKMVKEYGCNLENIICAIGPTIRQCHFEVDEDVKDMFYNQFKNLKNIEKIIIKGEKKHKYYIDTVEINKQNLQNAGIKLENILDSKICTVCNSNKIYSYRSGNKDERNTAIICLK